MSRRNAFVVLMLGLLLLPGRFSLAYVPNRTAVNGIVLDWNLTAPANPNAVDGATGEVLWHLDTDGSNDMPFAALEPVVQAAFDTW